MYKQQCHLQDMRKKSSYLHSTGKGFSGAQCPVHAHTSAGVQADWGSSLMKGLETVLTKLKERGLHSLEQRGLRIDVTAAFKYGPFLIEEGDNSCSGPLG